MSPRVGSYGDTPTLTRSPGTTLMRNRRILPLSCANTSCPGSACTRYKPPLWTAVTVPCTSMRSSFDKLTPIGALYQALVKATQRSPLSRSIKATLDAVLDHPTSNTSFSRIHSCIIAGWLRSGLRPAPRRARVELPRVHLGLKPRAPAMQTTPWPAFELAESALHHRQCDALRER